MEREQTIETMTAENAIKKRISPVERCAGVIEMMSSIAGPSSIVDWTTGTILLNKKTNRVVSLN